MKDKTIKYFGILFYDNDEKMWFIWCDIELRYIKLEDACPLCKIRKEVPNEKIRKTK